MLENKKEKKEIHFNSSVISPLVSMGGKQKTKKASQKKEGRGREKREMREREIQNL